MVKNYALLLSVVAAGLTANAQVNQLQYVGGYSTGSTESAETVAFDPTTKTIFYTSSSTNELGLLNATNVNAPTLIKTISLANYGGGPNSVDSKNGIVAVAVEANTKTNNGVVVFFDAAGTYLNQVTVGALPDMLTFNAAGTKVFVANEGEPSDDYTIDPEGSVSIIDLSSGVANASVTNISLASLNNQKVKLQSKGIRIFGNNGAQTVAQDLEPEYITLSADESMAFVNCQEANALLVIDLSTNTIADVQPLGYKNHLMGTPSLETYSLQNTTANWPTLGAPVYDGGQPMVNLGGFSGLFYDATQSTASSLVFYAIPDRGPNADAVGKATTTPAAVRDLRPYKLPDYQARIVKITLDKTTGTTTIDQTLLTRQDSVTPITGKGNIPGFDEIPVAFADANTAYPNADYTDANGETYHVLPYDELGGDFEGILRDNDGNFWMCDENRPAIYKFYPTGELIDRYVPAGSSNLGTTPVAMGTYGNETLPAVYSKRWANRGFEAIAYDNVNNVIYAFIQSPMYNPNSSTKNNSDVIRILAVDAANGSPVAEYVYLLENNKNTGHALSRVDKIGDACFIGDGKFLVVERDSEGPGVKEGKKMIFEINLLGATNTLTAFASDTLEIKSADQLMAMGIQSVHKTKVLNLPSIGYEGSDKVEGIALLPNNQIAVINDNDFGLAGAGITDNTDLGIISFGTNYGFDASDKDNAVNITGHPTLGMYMPDAIASYEVNGVNYIVTANEGDSRDYSGYSEEERVKDLTLDPMAYPNAAALQANGDLGRLKTTTATGDYDNDGDIDQIYSYGGRSFSIFDEYGNLVFDSGDDFAMYTNTNEPDLFNEDEGSMDGRSDDKGVEPEAVCVAEIDGGVYAFIGFERQSAIVVYNISDPFNPQFINYYSHRTLDTATGTTSGDIAPEIIKYISDAHSPNGKHMLLVGYEASGSVALISIDGNFQSISEYLRNEVGFKVFPNPAKGDVIYFDREVSGNIINQAGQLIKTFESASHLEVSDLEMGMYFIQTEDLGTQRFMKF